MSTDSQTPATPLTWRRACDNSSGNCVEVASVSGGVLVRDSKHPDGPRLAFTATAWSAFLAGARAGEFDA